MKNRMKALVSLATGAVLLSQAAMPAFAGELTAEELFGKYAFTYDIQYSETDGYTVYKVLNPFAEKVTDEQIAAFLELNEKVKAGEADISELLVPELLENKPYSGVTAEGFRYRTLTEDTVSITGADYSVLRTHFSDVVTIPDEIDGKKVVMIGANAFQYGRWYYGTSADGKHLRQLVVPDTVEIICDGAFSELNAYVNLPKNVKYLGSAYSDYVSPEDLPENIGPEYAKLAVSYELPECLEYMSPNAFAKKDGIELNLKMPESLIFIPAVYETGASGVKSNRSVTRYVDQEGNEVIVGITEEDVQEVMWGDTKLNAVTNTDAMRYYIDKNNPDYEYTETIETVYVYPVSTNLIYKGEDPEHPAYSEKIVRLGDYSIYGTQADVDAYEQFCAEHKGEKIELVYKNLIRQKGEPISAVFDRIHEDKGVPVWVSLGDVNDDGEFTVADSVLLARLVAEDTTVSVSPAGLANADMNGDGELTSEDTAALLKFLANK